MTVDRVERRSAKHNRCNLVPGFAHGSRMGDIGDGIMLAQIAEDGEQYVLQE